MKPTPAQWRALKWLYERGGSAILDPYGNAVARGERCATTAPTWLRLFLMGMVERGPYEGNFSISAAGIKALE